MISRDPFRVHSPLDVHTQFHFKYAYFSVVYSLFSCSNQELCSLPKYNTWPILRETKSILQLLLASMSMEPTPSGEGATLAQGCHFSLMIRCAMDIFMPQEIQHSVFSKNVDFLSSIPELGKIYMNQSMFYSFMPTLSFQLNE